MIVGNHKNVTPRFIKTEGCHEYECEDCLMKWGSESWRRRPPKECKSYLPKEKI